MIRLFLRLLNIKDYEVCASCETLKQQLALSNDERERLTETLLNLVKPQVIPQTVTQVNPVAQTIGTFSRRRAEAEKSDKIKERIVRDSPFIAKAEDLKLTPGLNTKDIDALEQELGIVEGKS